MTPVLAYTIVQKNSVDWLIDWLIDYSFTSYAKYFRRRMIMTSYTDPALYWSKTLSWIFIVLAYRSNSPLIGMSPHLDTIFSLRSNQSPYPLKYQELCGKAMSTNFRFFGVTLPCIDSKTPHTQSEHPILSPEIKKVVLRILYKMR